MNAQQTSYLLCHEPEGLVAIPSSSIEEILAIDASILSSVKTKGVPFLYHYNNELIHVEYCSSQSENFKFMRGSRLVILKREKNVSAIICQLVEEIARGVITYTNFGAYLRRGDLFYRVYPTSEGEVHEPH